MAEEISTTLPQLEIVVNPAIVTDALNASLKKLWDPRPLENYVSLIKETNKDLVVTESNLKDMEKLSKELGGKRTAIDNIRKDLAREMKAPIKTFEDQVKAALTKIDDVKGPIDKQIDVFEKKRREEEKKKIQGWIDDIAKQLQLRPEFAQQIEIDERWTNKTAKRSDTQAFIKGKALTLQEAQWAADREASQKEEKRKMAEELCRTLSEKNNLSTPICVNNIPDLDNQPLSELPRVIQELADTYKEVERKAVASKGGYVPLPILNLPPETMPLESAVPVVETQEEVYPCTLSILTSVEKMKGLKNYLITNQIQYEFKQQ